MIGEIGGGLFTKHSAVKDPTREAISPEELFVSSNDFNDSFRRWVTQAVKESVAMLTAAHTMLLNQKQSKDDMRGDLYASGAQGGAD